MVGLYNNDHIHFYLFLNSGSEAKATKDFDYLLSDLRDTLKFLSISQKHSNRGIQFNKRWCGANFHHVSNEFDDLVERALYLAKLDQEPRYTDKVLMFARRGEKPILPVKDVVSVDIHTSPDDENLYLDVYVKVLHPENLSYWLTKIANKVTHAIQPHHNKLNYQSNIPHIEEYLEGLGELFFI